MYPSLLAFHPDVAESVIEYRRKTLPAARENATRYGFKGAFFPWNGAGTGDLDECHSWDPPHCLTQIHLQGDIALSVWQYYLATGDTAWLRNHWTLLQSIAEFWAGRATAERGRQLLRQQRRGPGRVLERRRRRRLHQRRRRARAA